MRWLKHDEEELYDKAFQWPYEKRVNTFRMPRRGAKNRSTTGKLLAGSCSRVWKGTSRYLQLKSIWGHILTLCVDVNIVTPMHYMKATVGSPEFECTCQFVYYNVK